ncbi:uncharacterized protein LOC128998530 [Macrosteles quadrilineatus]|uniref:uncharacterized protein LOC128998530 n=1 Tax=Macrosteles quadrilineatus TaxID=74068 RepID=UPI0023E1FAAE|nr:uncharacterized protein LOC128998530 [Macrosteles quadrilineatus]
MIIWFLLVLTICGLQVAVGQDGPQHPKIIRTAPVMIPCLQCLQNSDMNLGATIIPSTQGCGSGCSCGCGGRNYEVEDPWRGQVEVGDEQGCSCCGTDNDEYSQGCEGSPSFGAAMLGPLASVLSSFMSGVGSNGNQAVTFDFDGASCDNPKNSPLQPQCEIPYNVANPQCEMPLNVANPQCEIPNSVPNPQFEIPNSVPNLQCQIPYNVENHQSEIPLNVANPQCQIPHSLANPQFDVRYNNVANSQPHVRYNQSHRNIPLTPLVTHEKDNTIYNNQSPHRVLRNNHPVVGPVCYRKSKKGVSDIEEDSLYAYGQEGPNKNNIYNQKITQGTDLNRGFPQSKHSPGGRDSNSIFPQPQPAQTGNPNFDGIPRLALTSSSQHIPYVQSGNQEKSIIPLN